MPIRQATVADATAILQLKIWVWGDDSADENEISISDFESNSALAQIESILKSDTHSTLVATEATGNVIGFVDGFMTIDYLGQRRWEVDLLAVHPDFRGQGLGKQLVTACIGQGQARDANISRGLIQTENMASAKAFQGVGFQTDGQVYHLHITTDHQASHQLPPTQLHMIPVETLTYRGFWAENSFTKEALQYCQSLVTPQHLVGILIPDREKVALNYAQDLEFTNLGSYCWWVYAQD